MKRCGRSWYKREGPEFKTPNPRDSGGRSIRCVRSRLNSASVLDSPKDWPKKEASTKSRPHRPHQMVIRDPEGFGTLNTEPLRAILITCKSNPKPPPSAFSSSAMSSSWLSPASRLSLETLHTRAVPGHRLQKVRWFFFFFGNRQDALFSIKRNKIIYKSRAEKKNERWKVLEVGKASKAYSRDIDWTGAEVSPARPSLWQHLTSFLAFDGTPDYSAPSKLSRLWALQRRRILTEEACKLSSGCCRAKDERIHQHAVRLPNRFEHTPLKLPGFWTCD